MSFRITLSRRYGAFRESSAPTPMLCRPSVIRETSNKALNAINDIHLIPFLMSFLASRDKLPSAPVISAGAPILTTLIISRELKLNYASTLSLCPDR